ncbi:hypothetical protein [uncultured Microbacterium sp.]|uniref:hypothetical protein n=1 Tax=uncultured Microbacterium sp. TaxID=191216 RepID=UPI0025E6225D|nr:hypothetical protein [uncultured Microbacterium sp.]
MSDAQVIVEIPELAPETAARLDAICEEAYAALRTDLGTLTDLAGLARKAWERETARPGGRRRIVIQRIPRAPEATPVARVLRSTSKTARRARSVAAWRRRHPRTDEQRARATARRAALRARLSDAEREANNLRQTELRHAAEAAMTADALQAKRAARRDRDRAREAALSPEEREARAEADRERRRAKYAAMSPEAREARSARQAAAYARRKAAGN